MTDVTNILSQIEGGDPSAAEKLLPLVYEELRRLASQKMATERKDHTLQGTALVHEAYLRLMGAGIEKWNSREHFFRVVAEAMRRILVESARRKKRLKRGGAADQIELVEAELMTHVAPDELLAVDETLQRLTDEDPQAAELVKLRYFAGFSVDEAADILQISRATAYRHWNYARAWMREELLSDKTD